MPVMSITFACESCGKSFTLDDKFAGKKGKCKQCGALMAIPEATASRASSRSVERETAPPRRPAAPSRPPIEDLYGLDEAPSATGLPAGVEEVAEALPVSRGFKPRSDRSFNPPKSVKKKKSGGGGGGSTVVKIVVGILFGIGALGGLGRLMLGMAGLSSKGQLESILKERVKLHEDLASLLANVNDTDSARSTSPTANEKFRAITANLRKLKATKGLQTDIDALKQQYATAQIQSSQRVVGEMNRISGIPDAREALAVEAALEELGREESAIPGISQPPPQPPFEPKAPFIPPGPPNAQPGMPPPGFNPGPPPGGNRPPGARGRAGARGKANRPNAGTPD